MSELNIGNGQSAVASLSCSEAWQKAEEMYPVIKECVDDAIAGGIINVQDRDSAIADCQIIAYELALRPDVENYERLLRFTLRRRSKDKFRPGTDAMSRLSDEYRTEDTNVERTEPSAQRPVYGARPSRANLTPAEVRRRIEQRVPPRLQAIARMALLERLTLTKIAHRTGRRKPGPKAELKKIIKRCCNDVYQQSAKHRRFNNGIKGIGKTVSEVLR